MGKRGLARVGLLTRLLCSYRLRDDCHHQAVDADTFAFGLFRQLGVESPRQALAPLRGLDSGLSPAARITDIELSFLLQNRLSVRGLSL